MANPQEFRVFLSAVSSEFETARDELANDFQSRDMLVRIQRSFRQEAAADTILRLLHDYIKACTAVVCVMGQRSGSLPTKEEARPFGHMLPPGFAEASYTQWEFFFARHYQKRLSIYIAREAYHPDRDAAAFDRPNLQASFLAHIKILGLHYTEFTEINELCRRVANEEWPPRIFAGALSPFHQPRNLPYATFGPRFKGRDADLEKLHRALEYQGTRKAAAVTGKALHGLGGVGKTRLAIEYAWRHDEDYSALLFVSAESPEQLKASLAALAGADILDLPVKETREDEIKIIAVRKWLDEHPGWLMILDNVDDDQAAKAVEDLIPELTDGRVLITGRITNFSPAVETLPLDVLAEADAASLLLDGTRNRETAPNDEALAHELAHELDGLALALAQAAAYINRQRIGFSRYLKLWKEKRETVLNWFDKRLVSYNHDVGLAATWMTSVEKLTPSGKYLLELCAFLAPDPIPKFLLDVPLPVTDKGFGSFTCWVWRIFKPRAVVKNLNTQDALADLYNYSLATPVAAKDPSFSIHRLVQDFTRRGLEKARRDRLLLAEALFWVDAAFTDDPDDVRSWPVLDPLAAHTLAVIEAADKAGFADPTARLMNQLGVLFHTKSRFAEAEPLMRRALAIDQESFGLNDPVVTNRFNNLAQLLQATNRFDEAEHLMRRTLEIDEKSFGPDRPHVARDLNNLATLLRDTGRQAEAESMYRRAITIAEISLWLHDANVGRYLGNLAQLLQADGRFAEAEPMYRRALMIHEKSFGDDHPIVATGLTNLAQLLQDTNRLDEAESLIRHALAVDEKYFGLDHPNVARDLNNLAALIQMTGRLDEAEPMYRRALAISEPTFGARSSRCRKKPRQSRPVAPGHQSSRRGRAVNASRPQNL